MKKSIIGKVSIICTVLCLSFSCERESEIVFFQTGVPVDLGLSVKWASCNVGANSPEDYGDYFAWGEVIPKKRDSAANNSYKYKMNGAYLKAENNKVLQQLNAAGLEPEYKNGKIINIKSKNGKISPEQRSIIQQIKRNPAYTRMMFENKLQTLKQELNEIKKRLK